jgi:antitoxin component of MazEF toxin-antitoxin module
MGERKLIRLGHSVGLVIPHETAKATGLRVGGSVRLRLRHKIIEIVPIHDSDTTSRSTVEGRNPDGAGGGPEGGGAGSDGDDDPRPS